VPLEHLTKALVLISHGPMSHGTALLIDCFDRARQASLRRLLPQLTVHC
jgi:hypothetical protein